MPSMIKCSGRDGFLSVAWIISPLMPAGFPLGTSARLGCFRRRYVSASSPSTAGPRATFTWTYTPADNMEFQWRNFVHDADRTFYFGQNLSGTGHWADPGLDSTHVADSPRLFTALGTEPRLAIRHGRHDTSLSLPSHPSRD